MARPRECEGCSQAHTCQEAYGGRDGKEGPALTGSALVAFGLPLAVFMVALGGFGRVLQGLVAEAHRTPLALVLALATTATVMLAVRLLTRLHRKK